MKDSTECLELKPVPLPQTIPWSVLGRPRRESNEPINKHRFSGKHAKITALHVAGKSRTEIATTIGCSLPTVTNTLMRDEARDVINGALDSINQDFNALKAPAVAALRDALSSTDETIALRAALGYFKEINMGQVQKNDTSIEDIISKAMDKLEGSNTKRVSIGIQLEGS